MASWLLNKTSLRSPMSRVQQLLPLARVQLRYYPQSNFCRQFSSSIQSSYGAPRPVQHLQYYSRSPFCNPTSKRTFASVSSLSMGTGSSKEGEEGQKKSRFSLKRSRKGKKGAKAASTEQPAEQQQPQAQKEEATAEQQAEGQTTAEVAQEKEDQTTEGGKPDEQAGKPAGQEEAGAQQQQEEKPDEQAGKPAGQEEVGTQQQQEPDEQAGKPAGQEEAGTQQQQEESEDFVQTVVAKASEFGDNEMREVDIGDSKALLIRQNGEFSAIGHKCTHYGAPLSKGFLGNGRVRCPWHGACFNIKSGDIEEFPGLDSVPCFQVSVEGDDIIIRAEKKDLETTKRTGKVCVAAPEEDERTFLIVGGGPASVACAETLRQEGFKGHIVLASRESVLPYDRPKLSKAMHLTPDAIILRSSDFYATHSIELKMGKEATSVDVEGKKVNFADGESISYDTLLLATGSKPRTLPIPGFDMENIYLLREPSHANQIAAAAQGKKVVIIGTSFIGMEVASYLADKAASISCVDLTAVPFERVLGERIGKMLQQMHEENGVKFYLSAGVKEFIGEDGKVSGVTLPSGETLEAEIVIAGVGVVPETNFLKDSGVPMTNRGEVIVDEHMKAAECVYAAGDIVRFPLPLVNSDANIGHWQIAHNHGRVAGRNMVGKDESFNSIPFFWTVMFGKSLRYCGFALSWDEIIYDGNPEERKFAAYFIKDDRVLAVASLNFDPAVSQSAELMYQGKMPSGTQLRENPDLKSHL